MVIRFNYKKGDGKMNLKEILKKHKMWLNGEEGGERANLKNANLSGVNLSGVDLSEADLNGVNLSNADLRYTNLRGANLSGADLNNANLRNADLRGVDLRDANLWNVNLRNADLKYANLRGINLRNSNLKYANLSDTNLMDADLGDADLKDADLRDTDLRCADLRNADLRDAILSNADLSGVITNMYTIGYNLVCPEEGSFIGYKKASRYIVKLLILEDAKRSSATTMKCRCDKAKVLDIENVETGEKIEEIESNFDSEFIYKVGEIVSVDNFDNDRWNECAPGIHFFMNKENAINY